MDEALAEIIGDLVIPGSNLDDIKPSTEQVGSIDGKELETGIAYSDVVVSRMLDVYKVAYKLRLVKGLLPLSYV